MPSLPCNISCRVGSVLMLISSFLFFYNPSFRRGGRPDDEEDAGETNTLLRKQAS